MKVLRIRKWGEQYETAETRKLKHLGWIALPNKQDGDGYADLLEDQEGPGRFACWIGILQLASKCAVRGTLVREVGSGLVPHDAATIARVTRMPRSLMDSAIPKLLEIGWLEWHELAEQPESPGAPAEDPGTPGANPGEPVQKGREGRGRKEGEGENATPSPASPSQSTSPEADNRTKLLGVLRRYGCALEMKGEGILPEWCAVCHGFEVDWVTEVLAKANPKPTLPSQLRKRLETQRKDYQNWKAARGSTR